MEEFHPNAYLCLLSNFKDYPGSAPQMIPLCPKSDADGIILGRGSVSKPVTYQLSVIEKKEVISRHHGSLKYRNEHWEIFDLNSSNGIFVNGVRIANGTNSDNSDKVTSLRHGDIVQFGGAVGNYVDGKKKKLVNKTDRDKVLTACIEYRYMCAYHIPIATSPSFNSPCVAASGVGSPSEAKGGSSQRSCKRKDSELFNSASKRFKHYLNHALESEAEFDAGGGYTDAALSDTKATPTYKDSSSIEGYCNSNRLALDMKLVLEKLIKIEEMVKVEPHSSASAAWSDVIDHSSMQVGDNVPHSIREHNRSNSLEDSKRMQQYFRFLETQLSCSLCNHILAKPCVLLCAHSFCQHCIETYYSSQPSTLCPVCDCSVEMVQSTSYDIYYNRSFVLDSVIKTMADFASYCVNSVKNRGGVGATDTGSSDYDTSGTTATRFSTLASETVFASDALQSIINSRSFDDNSHHDSLQHADSHPLHTLNLKMLKTQKETSSVVDHAITAGGSNNHEVHLVCSSVIPNSNEYRSLEKNLNRPSHSASLASTLFDSVEEPDY